MNDVGTLAINDTAPIGGLLVAQLRELIRKEVEAAVGQNQRSENRMLTVPETAAKLQKSKDWVYRHKTELPFKRVGRELRCSERELEKWLTRQRPAV